MARRTYAFQLYQSKRLQYLHTRIDLAAEIHNHLIAVQKRYYRRFHGYIGSYRLKRHVTRLKTWTRFAHWKQLDAQAIQHIVWRIDQGYQKFFRKENKRPPTFRKHVQYHSITLSQTGWRYEGHNRLWLFGRLYRFHHSRDIPGVIKTLTIKRLPTGRMMVMFSCVTEDAPIIRVKTGQTAGFDFGLSTFLTGSNGHDVTAPQPLKQSLRALRKVNRAFARTQQGSGHRRQARKRLAQAHADIAHQRQDWHWKLAHELCARYDTIYLEDLELRGMAVMWGRKIADLGFGRFVQILHQVAPQHGSHIHHIDRWFPSTKLCHVCGNLNAFITLRDRVWTCACGTVHHRDRNAATNIYQEGASSCEQGSCKTQVWAATA
jgi:Transposase and inactivated derivatives